MLRRLIVSWFLLHRQLFCVLFFLQVVPTKHDHHCLDELNGRPLAIYGATGVRREHGRLLLDVCVDPHVDGHHDQENHQVRHGPEDQVAPAEDGSQLGAVAQVADAVPAQTGHGPHEDGNGPNKYDEQGNPPLCQVAVDFPVHDGDVALQCYHQQVSQRGWQTDVQQALADEVSFNCQLPRHFACVKHEVHVCYPCEEVWSGEVGQKVVEREVKPLVGDHSSYDHGIGDQDETAEEWAHHLDQDELCFVPFIFSANVGVEEPHGLIVMTGLVLLGHRRGKSVRQERDRRLEICFSNPWILPFKSSNKFPN